MRRAQAEAPYPELFPPSAASAALKRGVCYPPILFGIEDLLQHGVEHSVGRHLGDLDPSVGELLLHVGHPDPDLLELGVVDVAGLVGVVLLEHLLQLHLRRLSWPWESN